MSQLLHDGLTWADKKATKLVLTLWAYMVSVGVHRVLYMCGRVGLGACMDRKGGPVNWTPHYPVLPPPQPRVRRPSFPWTLNATHEEFCWA
jgi:hypothetical protein